MESAWLLDYFTSLSSNIVAKKWTQIACFSHQDESGIFCVLNDGFVAVHGLITIQAIEKFEREKDLAIKHLNGAKIVIKEASKETLPGKELQSLLIIKSFDSCGTYDLDSNSGLPFVNSALCKQHFRRKKIAEFHSEEVIKIILTKGKKEEQQNGSILPVVPSRTDQEHLNDEWGESPMDILQITGTNACHDSQMDWFPATNSAFDEMLKNLPTEMSIENSAKLSSPPQNKEIPQKIPKNLPTEMCIETSAKLSSPPQNKEIPKEIPQEAIANSNSESSNEKQLQKQFLTSPLNNNNNGNDNDMDDDLCSETFEPSTNTQSTILSIDEDCNSTRIRNNNNTAKCVNLDDEEYQFLSFSVSNSLHDNSNAAMNYLSNEMENNHRRRKPESNYQITNGDISYNSLLTNSMTLEEQIYPTKIIGCVHSTITCCETCDMENEARRRRRRFFLRPPPQALYELARKNNFKCKCDK